MVAVQTDGDRLLADILANPEDEAVRLVYADWLDDQGDRYATLIRHTRPILLMRSAKSKWTYHDIRDLPPAPPGTPRSLIISEISHNASLIMAMANFLPDSVMQCVIRRGFVDVIRISRAEWKRHGPMLVKLHPITRIEARDQLPLVGGYRDIFSRRTVKEMDQESDSLIAWARKQQSAGVSS